MHVICARPEQIVTVLHSSDNKSEEWTQEA